MADDQTPMTTLVLPFGAEALARAGGLIGEGQPVAVPTETVYGLAADARDSAAVARIYAAKGRPDFNPLIVHVPSLAVAEKLGVFGKAERALAEAFWPGPLTLVVPRTHDCPVASIATAGLGTIAIRVPPFLGSTASGKFTELEMFPCSRYSRSSLAAMRAEFSSASCVDAPRCGSVTARGRVFSSGTGKSQT